MLGRSKVDGAPWSSAGGQSSQAERRVSGAGELCGLQAQPARAQMGGRGETQTPALFQQNLHRDRRLQAKVPRVSQAGGLREGAVTTSALWTLRKPHVRPLGPPQGCSAQGPRSSEVWPVKELPAGSRGPRGKPSTSRTAPTDLCTVTGTFWNLHCPIRPPAATC